MPVRHSQEAEHNCPLSTDIDLTVQKYDREGDPELSHCWQTFLPAVAPAQKPSENSFD
jgi:hypothetical protein